MAAIAEGPMPDTMKVSMIPAIDIKKNSRTAGQATESDFLKYSIFPSNLSYPSIRFRYFSMGISSAFGLSSLSLARIFEMVSFVSFIASS